MYQQSPGKLALIPLTPEWMLATAFLAVTSLLGIFWAPLLCAIPLFIVSTSLPVGQAVKSAMKARFLPKQRTLRERLKMRTAIAFLHLIQPVARLRGRLANGLTIWRNRGAKPKKLQISKKQQIWSEQWHPPEKWLGDLESAIQDHGAVYVRGGDFDNWDLDVFSGIFGAIRVKMTIEEHGAGNQLVRFKARPHMSKFKIALTAISILLTLFAALSGAWIPTGVMGAWTLCLLLKERRDTLSALTSYADAVETVEAILARPIVEKENELIPSEKAD